MSKPYLAASNLSFLLFCLLLICASNVSAKTYYGFQKSEISSFKYELGKFGKEKISNLTCSPTSISFNQNINEVLDSSDCVDNNFYYDVYTFQAVAGQQIAVSYISAAFDTVLLIADQNDQIISSDDNGGGGTNSRVPSSGFVTLPKTGTYQIVAATQTAGSLGAYSISLTGGSICERTAITFGQTIQTTMSSECVEPAGFYDQYYSFTGTAGQKIAVSMNSTTFDSYLFLKDINGNVLAVDNNGGGGLNARIPAGQAFFTLPFTGTYLIVTTSSNPAATGPYSVTLVKQGSKTPFDFDGDNKTDVGIFRPSDGSWWYSRSSDNSFRVYSFGTGTDIITPGDFTGDGKADIAVFRPSTGEWFVQRSENNSFFSFPFGTSGDIPAPSDYDGDGKTDAAVFRPDSGTWYILNSNGSGTSIVQFGSAEDKPVPADYDGDGKTDIAIFRPSDGSWWYLQSTNSQFKVYRFGVGTDKPVQGDYTGDGKADIAIFRPLTGEWFFQRSEDNSYFSVPFGSGGDIAAPGDYDGDGKFDTAVFRPSTADWFVQRSNAGILITNFGTNGDRPIPNAFVP
jgi:hypothetical protein